MRKVRLGGVLEVPMCTLGTMTWGEQNTEEEAFEQMDYALARGCNFWDTAEMYPVPPSAATAGRTETMIGNWLASRQCRDKIILASKVSGPMPDRAYIVANRRSTLGLPPSASPEQPQLSAEQIKMAVQASLKRLQTDFLDLYQLHWPSRYVPAFGKRKYEPEHERDAVSFEEQVLAMGDLIKEGKIRHWGVSNETSFGVAQFGETCKRLGVPPPISIQNDFSLTFRHFDNELAETCSARNYNLGLLAFGPLSGGTLSGKYADSANPPKGRHTSFPNFQPRYHKPSTLAAAAAYAALAKDKGISPTTLALAYCAGRPYMGSVIIGATTMAQLKENIDAFEVELDADTVAAIDEVHLRHRNPNATD